MAIKKTTQSGGHRERPSWMPSSFGGGGFNSFKYQMRDCKESLTELWENKLKPMGPKKLGIFGGIILLVIIAIFAVACGSRKKLNAADYVTAVFKGLNEEGTLAVSVDAEKLAADLGGKKGLSDEKRSALDALLPEMEKGYTVSKAEGLKNGDEIEITSGLDKKFLRDFGVNVNNSTIKVKADGLVPKTDLSLNDYITVNVSGFEGYGQAEIALDTDAVLSAVAEKKALLGLSDDNADAASLLDGVSFDQTTFDGLSTGDTVTSAVAVAESYLPSAGITFTCSDVSRSVSGLVPVVDLSLADFLDVTISGFEGFGYANAEFNASAAAAALEKAFAAEERAAYGFEKGSAADAADVIASSVADAFTIAAEPAEGLSNGETVTAVAARNNGSLYIPEIGVNLNGGEKAVTAAGLKDTRSLSLNDYSYLDFEGFEGAGRAFYVFDEDSLIADGGAILMEQNPGMNGEEAENEIRRVFAAAAGDEDLPTALQNGQRVTVPMGVDMNMLGDKGLVFSAKEITSVITGLVEPEQLDLSDALSVSFTGTAPNLTAIRTVDESQPFVRYTSMYGMDAEEGITADNGDLYSMTFTYDAEKLLEMGYAVSSDTVEAEVSGVPTLKVTLDGADDERLSSFIQAAEEAAIAQVLTEGSDVRASLAGEGYVVWNGMTASYEKETFASSSSMAAPGNSLYLVNHVVIPVRNAGSEAENKDIYYVTFSDDIISEPDGTLTANNGWEGKLYATEAEADSAIQSRIAQRFVNDCVITSATSAGPKSEETAEASEEAAEEASEEISEEVSEEAAEETPEEIPAEEAAAAEAPANAVSYGSLKTLASYASFWYDDEDAPLYDASGEPMVKAIALNATEGGRVVIALAKKYSTFAGTFHICSDPESPDDYVALTIYVDGIPACTIDPLTVLDEPVSFAIDVKNAQTLDIRAATTLGHENALWCAVESPEFFK